MEIETAKFWCLPCEQVTPHLLSFIRPGYPETQAECTVCSTGQTIDLFDPDDDRDR